MAGAPGAESAVVGDLLQIRDMKSVADQINRLGRFDAVIHNAGVKAWPQSAPSCFIRGK
jgi:hypothetical protein